MRKILLLVPVVIFTFLGLFVGFLFSSFQEDTFFGVGVDAYSVLKFTIELVFYVWHMYLLYIAIHYIISLIIYLFWTKKAQKTEPLRIFWSVLILSSIFSFFINFYVGAFKYGVYIF